jgi:oligoribonuclease NrnB/cAMP/cGMP phosphodiesterase (DHH superfamily)
LQFDLEQSGATLALGYFKPEVSENLRKIYLYVEDNDLWRHKLEKSKIFSSGMRTVDLLDTSSLFETLEKLDFTELMKVGDGVHEAEQNKLRAELDRKYVVRIGGGDKCCYAVNTKFPDLRSPMGNELAKLSQEAGFLPMGAVCYPEQHNEGQMKVSLRSLGACDTTIYSTQFGGGGHLNASSFIVGSDTLESWRKH